MDLVASTTSCRVAFRACGGLIFDIYMDIGGMCDIHRHRQQAEEATGLPIARSHRVVVEAQAAARSAARLVEAT